MFIYTFVIELDKTLTFTVRGRKNSNTSSSLPVHDQRRWESHELCLYGLWSISKQLTQSQAFYQNIRPLPQAFMHEYDTKWVHKTTMKKSCSYKQWKKLNFLFILLLLKTHVNRVYLTRLKGIEHRPSM